MRALAVVLLLSVPLAADDESSLGKAVKLFKSPDAGQRTAGSQLAERELRRLLTPLLEAMKDDDPEVRRRARRSILSLVPGEVEKEKKRDGAVAVKVVIGLGGGAGGAFRGRPGRRGFKAFVARSEPLQPTQKQRAILMRTGARLLPGLGLSWKAQWQAPLMPGFRVHGVKRGRAARMGLRKGDLIVRINGVDVAGLRGAPKAVDWSRATVTVYRDGRYVRLPRLPPK